MINADGRGLEIYPLKSRVLRTVYYDNTTRKMVLELTQGKVRIYKNIEKELVKLLVNHPAPGMFYDQKLKAALKPLLCSRASQLLLVRHVRQIARSSGLGQATPSFQ